MQERTLKTLADRLNYAMHEMGMSRGQLAKAANMAQPTIWRITSGNARGTTKIVEIANATGVRSEWLSNGTGPMRGDDQQPPPPMNNKKDPAIFRVDVLDLTVSAGPGIINSEFVEVLRSVEYSVEDARQMFNGRKQEQIRIINVRGDSMSGTIERGTYSSSISAFSISTATVYTRSSTMTHRMLSAYKR